MTSTGLMRRVVSFAIDGRAYEIDLSEDNAARLRESLASFVAAARKSGGSVAAAARRTPKMTASSGPATAAVGPGAGHGDPGVGPADGHQVSERGRISKTLVDAFQAAH